MRPAKVKDVRHVEVFLSNNEGSRSTDKRFL